MPTLEDVPVHDTKTCASCGRTIEWRKKWARSWDDVKYCSDACRRHKVTDTDRALEASIRSLLDSRKGGATICPSEAAREVGGEDGYVRIVGRKKDMIIRGGYTVAAGEVEVTQGGKVVDPSTARGPIRVRRAL